MPAVDIAPLMDSPVWKSWDPATRQEALRLWQDKDTSAEDRAEMRRLVTAASSRLGELEAEVARRDAQPPAEEPITPEARFLHLPSVQQLPLEERTQRFKDFYGLRPELKEEFLRSEEPPSDLVVDIEKPSPPAPTGWRAGLPQTPEEWDRRMAPMREQMEATRRSALPMALSAVPGGLGYTLGTKIAPALGAMGKVVPPLLEAAGGYLGRRANVALGHEEEGVGGDLLSLLPWQRGVWAVPRRDG